MRGISNYLLLLPLAVGCSAITDYDYRFDGSGADSSMDGGVDSAIDGGLDSAVDGAMDSGDGASDAGDATLDAAPDTGPDAGVGCPEPCLGELAVDARDEMQATGTVDWRYLVDMRAADGLDYGELPWVTDRWAGSGAIIERCGSGCADDGAFRLTSATADATVEFTVFDRGVYRVGGVYEPLEGASQELLISRDGRNDALHRLAGRAGDAARAFDLVIYLEADDVVRLTIRPLDGQPTAAGALSPWIAGPFDASADACLVAADFDDTPSGSGTWQAQCGPATPTGRGGTRPTVEMSSIGFGNAVHMASADGSYVRIDGTSGLGLSGDFTIQLWGRYDNLDGGERNFRTLVSNVPADLGNGLFLDHGGSMSFGYYSGSDQPIEETGFDPTPGTWHFFRLVREGTSLRLCVDGTRRGMPLDVGARDLTSTISLHLGYQPFLGPFLNGAVDEFRVYSQALPCAVPLP